jgi:hypothetical protein
MLSASRADENDAAAQMAQKTAFHRFHYGAMLSLCQTGADTLDGLFRLRQRFELAIDLLGVVTSLRRLRVLTYQQVFHLLPDVARWAAGISIRPVFDTHPATLKISHYSSSSIVNRRSYPP